MTASNHPTCRGDKLHVYLECTSSGAHGFDMSVTYRPLQDVTRSCVVHRNLVYTKVYVHLGYPIRQVPLCPGGPRRRRGGTALGTRPCAARGVSSLARTGTGVRSSPCMLRCLRHFTTQFIRIGYKARSFFVVRIWSGSAIARDTTGASNVKLCTRTGWRCG